MTKNGELQLSDIAIGCEFTLPGQKKVWIKRTIQGMENQCSYAESKKKYGTRTPNNAKTHWRLFEQKDIISTSNCI